MKAPSQSKDIFHECASLVPLSLVRSQYYHLSVPRATEAEVFVEELACLCGRDVRVCVSLSTP